MTIPSQLIAGVFLLTSIASEAATDVTVPDGRTVRLNEDHTWHYVDDTEDPEITYAVLSVESKRTSPNGGCRFGLKMQNDLGFHIKSLVPAFSAYKKGNLLYQTIYRDFYEIKPTNSRYREIHYSGTSCEEIDFLKVHSADRCTMGPLTKYSSTGGECLERIKLKPSDLVKFVK